MLENFPPLGWHIVLEDRIVTLRHLPIRCSAYLYQQESCGMNFVGKLGQKMLWDRLQSPSPQRVDKNDIFTQRGPMIPSDASRVFAHLRATVHQTGITGKSDFFQHILEQVHPSLGQPPRGMTTRNARRRVIPLRDILV
ncbi:hypothetical protein WS75_16275 [Burkholderia sp. FL-7-2-10-S1-D7]|nr:hypothetical protein WS75_16275 [Burkholderia sp. FL-7-2-10-S1-D7]